MRDSLYDEVLGKILGAVALDTSTRTQNAVSRVVEQDDVKQPDAHHHPIDATEQEESCFPGYKFEDSAFATGMHAEPDETRVGSFLYGMGLWARIVPSSLMSDEDTSRVDKVELYVEEVLRAISPDFAVLRDDFRAHQRADWERAQLPTYCEQ
ncbi:hypothetical protein MRX96_058878 [Rhipicephalus microplus]